jgi:dTDP-glucose 4,6-dehydratase
MVRKTIKWYKENQDWWKRVKNGDYQKYYEKQYGSL